MRIKFTVVPNYYANSHILVIMYAELYNTNMEWSSLVGRNSALPWCGEGKLKELKGNQFQ